MRGKADFQFNAVSATRALQSWYNQSTGLYQGTGWWNSANCITTLAELTAIERQVDIVTGQIWGNTFDKAQKFNLRQAKSPNNCPTTVCMAKRDTTAVNETRDATEVNEKRDTTEILEKRSTTIVNGVQMEDADPLGFLNGFYDDEGWWALAWLKVYDLTKTPQYLKAATDIFEDMLSTGYNATCGGIWWDKKKTSNTAIANELFMSVAAHLANRMPERKDYYASWANRQWTWFERSGLINAQNTINDGLDVKTCKNDKGEVWSYNQGVILGALVELDKATPNGTYLLRAMDIANGALKTMCDKDGIIHDPREPNLGGDGYQFKGVFNRNMLELWRATGNENYRIFLEKNAESVWEKARNDKDNVLTGVWSGPFDPAHANAATQSSGLDALVAAAGIQ